MADTSNVSLNRSIFVAPFSGTSIFSEFLVNFLLENFAFLSVS